MRGLLGDGGSSFSGPMHDILRIALIAVVAMMVAKVVIPKVPVVNGLAAYL
jgi:hypothetical protein